MGIERKRWLGGSLHRLHGAKGLRLLAAPDGRQALFRKFQAPSRKERRGSLLRSLLLEAPPPSP
jgi:hypothetical protein